MSDRRTHRPPRKAPIVIQRQADGSYILTAHAPRDGAGRETSAADLHYPMTRSEARTFSNDLILLLAGDDGA